MDIERVLNILENYESMTLSKEDQDSLVTTLQNMDLGTLGPDTRVMAEKILNGTVTTIPVVENVTEAVESNVEVPQDEPVQEVTVPEPVMEQPEVAVETASVVEQITPVVEQPSTPVEPMTTAEPVMETVPVMEPVQEMPSVDPVMPVSPEPTPVVEEPNTVLETAPTVPTLEPEFEKPRKKTNPILIVLLIVVLLAAAGVLYYLHTQNIITIPFLSNNSGNTENDSQELYCIADNITSQEAAGKEEFKGTYDKDGNLIIGVITSTTTYKNESDYLAAKERYDETVNLTGITYQVSFDDINKVILLITTIDVKTAIETDYDATIKLINDAKTKYETNGFTCNGGTSNVTPDPDPTPNPDPTPDPDPTPNPASNLVAITETGSGKNSVFEYSNVKITVETNAKSLKVTANLKNIAKETQMMNIRLKLYDDKKVELGTVQYRNHLKVSDTSSFAVLVNGTKEVELNLYSDTFDVSNAKYYEIIDIEV